jgi:hypothetical protein
MQRILFSILLLSLVVAGAAPAAAQEYFYCVKPAGAPVASIIMPAGTRHDPSVVCNAMVPQCFLTCAAVQQLHEGQAVLPPNLPSLTVTPQMLSGLGAPAYESPAQCESQYQACMAKCRGDRDCQSYCRSVRSGCGTGNSRVGQ